MDSADCSQINVVPRIVPCVQHSDPIKLFPRAARYAISSYLADANAAPRWQLALTILCELTSITIALALVLAYFSGQFEDKAKWIQGLVIIPAGLALVPFGVWWLLAKAPSAAIRIPARLAESIRDRTLRSKIRTFNWGSAVTSNDCGRATPGSLLVIFFQNRDARCLRQGFERVEGGLSLNAWLIACIAELRRLRPRRRDGQLIGIIIFVRTVGHIFQDVSHGSNLKGDAIGRCSGELGVDEVDMSLGRDLVGGIGEFDGACFAEPILQIA